MVYQSFEDVSEAREQGFFERAWLPDVLPDEAGPIDDVHDHGTNARCSRSGFQPQMEEVLEDRLVLRELFAPTVGVPQVLPFGECPFSAEDIASCDLMYSRPSRGWEYVCLDREKGALYYWTSGA